MAANFRCRATQEINREYGVQVLQYRRSRWLPTADLNLAYFRYISCSAPPQPVELNVLVGLVFIFLARTPVPQKKIIKKNQRRRDRLLGSKSLN